MKRKLDIVDLIVASGLAAIIVIWSFVWAHPYPHPDLWPFLAAIGRRVPLAALSVCGKLGLGLFAAAAYAVVRSSWMLHRDEDDDLPDAFFFTRFAPLCAALMLTCIPFVWRPAQFAAPGFVLALVILIGIGLWQYARLFDGLASYFFAYVLLAFAAGMTPVGLIAVGYVGIADIVSGGWGLSRDKGNAAALKAFLRRSTQNALSLVGAALGLIAAIGFGAFYFTHGFPTGGIVGIVLAWWNGYVGSFWPVVTSPLVVSLAVAACLIVGALALGRRIRATGPQTLRVAVVLACLLGVVAVMTLLRAVDRPERLRLQMVGEYVRQTIADADGAIWLFTDGRFDDGLRYESKRQRRPMVILDALNAPSKDEAETLRDYVPEPGDRDLFSAGGSEVFKAWARERPDRLKDAAWLFGGGMVRRFDRIEQRTGGTLLRCADETAAERMDAADCAFRDFSKRLFALLERPVTHGIPFGSVDERLAAVCDAMLWRAARQAGERSEALNAAGKVNDAQREKALMQQLDVANASLRSQGNMLERLLPTANLVLTPRESLEIALKRADFFLAQRYANEVLVGSPNDVKAHFALGMHGLEVQDYFVAVQHFEAVLRVKPNEPAVLNNLAMAYLKLEKYDEAFATALRAQKANPDSKEIRGNIEAIRKAMDPAKSER